MKKTRSLKIWGSVTFVLLLCFVLNHVFFFLPTSSYGSNPQSAALLFCLVNGSLLLALFFAALTVIRSHLKDIRLEAEDILVSSVGRVVKRLAHDLRRPISMLQALIGIIETRGAKAGPATLVKHLPNIEESIDKLDDTLERIFQLSGRAKINIEEKSLLSLLNDSLRNFEGSLRHKKINFTFPKISEHNVKLDFKEVGAALEILFENAYDAMPANSDLALSSWPSEGKFCVLELRYKTDPIRLNPVLETGMFALSSTPLDLGLALARRVISFYGGTIHQTRRDNLITVQVSMPLGENPVSEDQVYDFSNFSLRADKPKGSREIDNIRKIAALKESLTILVVDDENFYRSMLAEQIRAVHRNATLVIADSSRLAADRVGKHKIDFAFLDLDLGTASEDGFFLLKTIKENSPDAKVCIHSNHSCDHFRDEALERGADMFMPKPAERKHLVHFIANYL